MVVASFVVADKLCMGTGSLSSRSKRSSKLRGNRAKQLHEDCWREMRKEGDLSCDTSPNVEQDDITNHEQWWLTYVSEAFSFYFEQARRSTTTQPNRKTIVIESSLTEKPKGRERPHDPSLHLNCSLYILTAVVNYRYFTLFTCKVFDSLSLHIVKYNFCLQTLLIRVPITWQRRKV